MEGNITNNALLKYGSVLEANIEFNKLLQPKLEQ